MARRANTRLISLPGKHSMYRATMLLMITMGLALFIMGRSGNPAVERLRGVIADTITPVLEFTARPFDAVADIGAWIATMAQLKAENVALKNQNLQLLKWQDAARDMSVENHSLKKLLKVVPAQSRSYVTARVVSDLGGPYVHSALINGGTESGIRKNQAVVNESGLVGRVIEAGETSARILLLSDINSRVPVVAEQSHEKSILVGNNDELPTLSYLASGSRIAVGERVVTSGDGGVFPAGLPVGIVTSVEKGTIRVQPFVDAGKIEYVSAIDYSF